jgi:hypothetical protein
VLGVEVHAGDHHTAKHGQPGLLKILDDLPPERKPKLVRGDNAFGNDPMMSALEARGQPYLFKLKCSKNVKRHIVRVFRESGWTDAGQGWEGKDGALALNGWHRSRRVVVLRRPLNGEVVITQENEGQQLLGFIEADRNAGKQITGYEYAVLVTNTDYEILALGQLYRDRADAENAFDELKNQWGWGGFTTHDLARCQLMARIVALAYNWWTLFGRLADPDRHHEAITSRPLMMHAIARRTEHAGRTTLTITSTHGDHAQARRAYRRIAAFFDTLRSTAEQLTPLQRLYRILSEAMKKYLRGRQLRPPPPILSPA